MDPVTACICNQTFFTVEMSPGKGYPFAAVSLAALCVVEDKQARPPLSKLYREKQNGLSCLRLLSAGPGIFYAFNSNFVVHAAHKEHPLTDKGQRGYLALLFDSPGSLKVVL